MQDGMRFIYRSGAYSWTHRLEMIQGDIDCTDMSDDEFDQFVRDRD